MIHVAQVPGHSFFFFQKSVKNIFICSCIIVVAHSVPSPGERHTPSFPSVQECADEVRSFNTIPTPSQAIMELLGDIAVELFFITANTHTSTVWSTLWVFLMSGSQPPLLLWWVYSVNRTATFPGLIIHIKKGKCAHIKLGIEVKV